MVTELRKAGLRWIERQGRAVEGSVLHAGSGPDTYHYKRFFPSSKRFRNLDKSKFDNVDVVANVEDMPGVPSNSEDCILATFMIYQVSDVEAALREFRRVLKLRGVLLMTFTAPSWRGHGGKRFPKATAFKLVERHFEIKEVEEYVEKGELICTFIRAT